MSTLKAFFEAGKTILSFGSSVNASGRDEIRNVVGQLSDELDRALLLADSYLVGVQYSRDEHELAQYLQAANGKLMNGMHEHHVCAALYQLADKFAQIFDPTRFSVSIGQYRQIPDLVQHLKNGERAVIDALDEMVVGLQQQSVRLVNAAPADVAGIKRNIDADVSRYRREIEQYRKDVRSTRREITDSL